MYGKRPLFGTDGEGGVGDLAGDGLRGNSDGIAQLPIIPYVGGTADGLDAAAGLGGKNHCTSDRGRGCELEELFAHAAPPTNVMAAAIPAPIQRKRLRIARRPTGQLSTMSVPSARLNMRIQRLPSFARISASASARLISEIL